MRGNLKAKAATSAFAAALIFAIMVILLIYAPLKEGLSADRIFLGIILSVILVMPLMMSLSILREAVLGLKDFGGFSVTHNGEPVDPLDRLRVKKGADGNWSVLYPSGWLVPFGSWESAMGFAIRETKKMNDS